MNKRTLPDFDYLGVLQRMSELRRWHAAERRKRLRSLYQNEVERPEERQPRAAELFWSPEEVEQLYATAGQTDETRDKEKGD